MTPFMDIFIRLRDDPVHIHSTHTPGRTIVPFIADKRGAVTFRVDFSPKGGHSHVGTRPTDGPDRTNLQQEKRHATA